MMGKMYPSFESEKACGGGRKIGMKTNKTLTIRTGIGVTKRGCLDVCLCVAVVMDFDRCRGQESEKSKTETLRKGYRTYSSFCATPINKTPAGLYSGEAKPKSDQRSGDQKP